MDILFYLEAENHSVIAEEPEPKPTGKGVSR